MSLTLRTTFGCTEATIDAAGTLKQFYQIANIIADELGAAFTRKEDDFDAISWDFVLQRYHLTLQYSIYNGISVFPTRTKDARSRENEAVIELAHVLDDKLRKADVRKTTM